MTDTTRYIPIFGDVEDLALVDFTAGLPFGSADEAAETVNNLMADAENAAIAATAAERLAARERLKSTHFRVTGETLAAQGADDWDPYFTGDPEEDYIDENGIDLALLNARIVGGRWRSIPYGETCVPSHPSWWETVRGGAA